MKFSEIKPFGRYIRYLKITEQSAFRKSLPLDCRLFYVKKGEGKIKIDGRIITLPTGSLLYINSFVPYTLLKSDVGYLAINFDFTSNFSYVTTPLPPADAENAQGISPIEEVRFEDAPCFDRYLFLEKAFFLSGFFEAAERVFVEKPPFYNLENSAQITNILTRIYRNNEFKNSEEQLFNLEKVAEYIRENLSDNLTNKTLAERFHFHPNYLSSRFNQHYGKPLHSYILEMRILKAISLLEGGRKSIGEIAVKVGFADQNYFTRYFKKITGTTPKAYLSKNKQ